MSKPTKVELRGRDPTKVWYMAITVWELDGSLDDDFSQGVEGIFESEAEAVERLRGVNESYPSLDGYVLEIRPVRHVWRGPIRVSPIERRFTPKKTEDRWPKNDLAERQRVLAKGDEGQSDATLREIG